MTGHHHRPLRCLGVRHHPDLRPTDNLRQRATAVEAFYLALGRWRRRDRPRRLSSIPEKTGKGRILRSGTFTLLTAQTAEPLNLIDVREVSKNDSCSSRLPREKRV